MNLDDIIRMAREYASTLRRIAALVAAQEREACAKVCEEHKALRLAEMIRTGGNEHDDF